jgi:outer membrane protein OmpA-like peptidoglycan-associated protein
VAGAAGGKKVVISGFHDATGSAEVNAELAKLRALAVHSDLMQSGVAQDLIELKKPEVTLATGSNAEARRVEVTLQ